MKRKLINFDAFKQIEESSLTKVQNELVKAEEVLARSFGVEGLKLHTFGESDVTYQAADGNYIHATYRVTDSEVILENIEVLVVDEESQRKSARETLSAMIDSLLENQEAKASTLFETYMGTPCIKSGLMNEAVKPAVAGGKPHPLAGRKQSPATIAARTAARKAALAKLPPWERKKRLGRPKKGTPEAIMHKKVTGKTMKEWARMCENVMGYIDVASGTQHVVRATGADERGNVTAVRFPTAAKRNEGKILDMGLKTIDAEVKVLRGKMKKIHEDQMFAKAMADLKRYNNISDNRNLEETLEAIVARWPDLIYVSESELAGSIGAALESANVSNYDDNTCAFMAEAILRTAHGVYTDRVSKLAKIAGSADDVTSEAKVDDAYAQFSALSQQVFGRMDEQEEAELRIFSDLYNALHEVHRAAVETGDEATRIEAAEFLKECQSVLNGATSIDMDLAESIAEYLADLIEASMEGDKGWDHGVEVSVGGDHTMTKWNAKQAAVASNSTGGWKGAAPVSDGKDHDGGEEMGHNSLANLSNSDIYPDLKNPYVPKSMAPKVHDTPSEPEDGLSTNQGKDTWPNLSNPLALKPVMPKVVEAYAINPQGQVAGSGPATNARQAINDAETKIKFAMKTGDRQGAMNAKVKLRMDLEKMGYNWKSDPHALELLS